jgi:hypothetical protein
VAATSWESMVVMNAGKGRDRFTLIAYLPPDDTTSGEECLRSVQEKVGWELETVPEPKRVEPPAKEELTLLRLFDPRGFFIGI